jgi:hypothetical protein
MLAPAKTKIATTNRFFFQLVLRSTMVAAKETRDYQAKVSQLERVPDCSASSVPIQRIGALRGSGMI